MKIVFLTILLFISFLTGTAQELSLHELYSHTNHISTLINQGAYLEALDRAQRFNFMVQDALGRIIHQEFLEGKSGLNIIRLDLYEFESGVYNYSVILINCFTNNP